MSPENTIQCRTTLPPAARPTMESAAVRTNMPCGACRTLRRRCKKDCILLPHFPPSEPEKFIAVHRVFGASNVCKMLLYSPKEVIGFVFLFVSHQFSPSKEAVSVYLLLMEHFIFFVLCCIGTLLLVFNLDSSNFH